MLLPRLNAFLLSLAVKSICYLPRETRGIVN